MPFGAIEIVLAVTAFLLVIGAWRLLRNVFSSRRVGKVSDSSSGRSFRKLDRPQVTDGNIRPATVSFTDEELLAEMQRRAELGS